MSNADRLYKVLRANLTADQTMQLSEQMANMLSDTDLKLLEVSVENLKTAPKSVAVKELDPRSYELADVLIERVLERYPYYKNTINRQNVAKDITKILKLNDKITYDVIKVVMDWTFEDEFWQKQIRSGANFHKHFLRLLSNAQDAYQGQQIAEI